MKTNIVLHHHRSEFDRVMTRPQVEVPRWLLLLLAGVVGVGAMVAIGMLIMSVVNTPTVWFTYVGHNERGELVKVQIGDEVILAKDLTKERRRQILSSGYNIEYVDPRGNRK